MEVMGIIGAVEEERRWRVHVGERRGGSGRALLILLLILLLAEGMCTCTCGCLSLACLSSIVTATGTPHLGSWHLTAIVP